MQTYLNLNNIDVVCLGDLVQNIKVVLYDTIQSILYKVVFIIGINF